MTIERLCDNVLNILAEAKSAIKLLDISKKIGVKSDSENYEKLKDALQLLVEQNLVKKSARRMYSLQTNDFSGGLVGTLTIDELGSYVITNDAKFPVIFIAEKFLNTALNGDTARVKLILQNKKKKKPRGEIVEVLSRNITEITGTIEFDEHFYFLVPDQKTYKIDFLIPTKDLAGARHGDKVIAEFVKWSNPTKNPQAKVKEIIGRSGDPIVEYEAIIKEFGIPTSFPKAVINEALNVKKPVNRKYADRLDLRNELIITIDPATAKDFDDAVSLKKLENGNYYLGVHIADVSHYVTENSALDKEAAERGNSIYLVDRVIPMLPEKISNDVCSLNPDEPRFTFSVFMEINQELSVVDYKISPSIIKSKRRYSYEEVQDIIDTEQGENAEFIVELSKLADRVRNLRIREGSINYDSSEVKYILNDEKFPIDVEIHKTTEATSLIEECMLLANKTVAKHIKKLGEEFKVSKPLPFLYRIHDKPKQETLAEALEFIKTLGYRVSKKRITPNDINELLQKVKYNPENKIVNQVLIRSMAKAVYSSVNIGHYGLGFADYSHFTSPIRRYPDLLVHRLLKEYSAGNPNIKRIKELAGIVNFAAAHSTEMERAAMEAERASTKLAGTIYASTVVGNVYSGTISGVVQYGLFVLLDEIYCEGFLHTRDLPDDYYRFDSKKLRIAGKSTKHIFTLGSRVRMRIVKVNIEKRQIDLVMVDGE